MADEIRYVFIGESRKHKCDACGRHEQMLIEKDSRGIEQKQLDDGRTMTTDKRGTGDLDPPLAPPIYECPRCHHRHAYAPGTSV